MTTDDRWRVTDRCIDCMASRTMAPTFIGRADGTSVFERQPESERELLDAWRALEVCPTAAVRAPKGLVRPRGLFPQDVGHGTFRLGFNARASYGAHSYFATAAGAGLMIDAPRWSPHVVRFLEERGGLEHVLLTHRDDIADARRYAEHFGARVWIHERDADAAPFASDVMRGETPTGPADVEVIFVPGHTRGSVMYLVGTTLFTGDSLAWNPLTEELEAYPEVAWYDWDLQVRSLGALRGRGFERVFAGHGGSGERSADEMQRALAGLLERAGSK
ncbi:MAG: MBL fold metallo-hydrolase [Sandaracinus sp.]|nr:MBL fold metallo-hydrolase [Sandaracinus sp.]